MKTTKTKHIRKVATHRMLSTAHLIELVVAIIIFAGGQSLWTTFVRADADITPPSVPSGLALAGRSASEIDLSWAASTDDTAVTGYNIYRGGTLIGTSATASYSDTGLVPNTSYTYTVSAYDAATNTSAQSSPLVTSTLADTSPPSTPANVHQTAQSTSSLTVAWNASSDNVGVTGYNIYRNGSLIRSQAATSLTDTGLAVYTSYSYTIQAYDAAGNTSNLSSALLAATAPDTAPPTVPDNVHETGSTITSVTLAWDASSDDVGVAGYHVYRNGSLVGSPGGASFTDTGLSVNNSYTYTVSAYDAATNASAQSAPFSASSSADTTAPTIPSNVAQTSVLDNAISLSWDASTDDVGVSGYKIYRDGSLVGTSTTTNFTDSGLQPVTTYMYTVKAYDAANNASAASAPLSVKTAFDTTLPSVPADLSSTTQTDSSISLSWSAATDNIGVAGYNLYRDGTLITSTFSTSYTDSGLAVDTPHDYTIESYDTSGNVSGQSAPVTISTLPDTVAPAAPTGLASSSQTTTSIDLSWSAATDDVAVASYNLYRNGTFVTNVGGLSYSDTSLTYNTSYQYTVTAVDASDNESVGSTPFSIATLPDTTPPVVNITAPADGSADQLTFLISATASDDLALASVQFYVDGNLISTTTSAPFALNWNSYAVHNGSHVLSAKATDVSGNYSAASITVTINNPPPPILGDLNGDHRVNIFDLSILLSHWNKSGSGDFNNNGRIDIFDLSNLLSHYGQDNSNYN
jgi:chitodextrinase